MNFKVILVLHFTKFMKNAISNYKDLTMLWILYPSWQQMQAWVPYIFVFFIFIDIYV